MVWIDWPRWKSVRSWSAVFPSVLQRRAAEKSHVCRNTTLKHAWYCVTFAKHFEPHDYFSMIGVTWFLNMFVVLGNRVHFVAFRESVFLVEVSRGVIHTVGRADDRWA